MRAYRYQRDSFTLIELLVLLVVIGVLLSFAVAAYMGTKKKIRDYEAKSNLGLIQAAEKNYRLETHGYVVCTTTAECNSFLGLELPLGSYWQYSVPSVDNEADPPTFCIQALYTQGDISEAWHINADDTEAADCDCNGSSCTGR